MSLRSWVIRGLILTGVASLAAIGWVAQSWVSPERVRAQVIAGLSEEFEGVHVEVGGARLRLFGGISVTDIKLTREGEQSPFMAVPSAVLHHDKEQLSRGRLVLKKIELEKPEIRLVRSPEGKWNVSGLVRPTTPDKPIPTFMFTGATVHLEDRGPDPFPEFTFSDADVTLLNDPLPVLAVQVRGVAGGFGSVAVRGRINRTNGEMAIGIEMPQFPLGEAIPLAAAKFAPDLAGHLTGLTATAAVTADLTYTPGAAQPWSHDVRVEMSGAKFTHAECPWPIEQIAAIVHITNGQVKTNDATATVNGAKVKLSFETRLDSANPERPTLRETATPAVAVESTAPHIDAIQSLEDHLQRAELSITGVKLGDEIFKHLPEEATEVRGMFSPVGNVDLGYRFTRDTNVWKRELELRPKQITAAYEKFKYPVTDLRGWMKRTVVPGETPVTAIDLIGTAGGQLITIKGQLTGNGPDPGINLRISGANITLDDTLVNAFPPKYVDLVRRFRATGRGDFVAEIVQQPNVNLCENEFRVDVRDATVNHTEFPYPLEKVKGRLVIRTSVSHPARPVREGEAAGPPPDRDELVLDGFTALHAGATIRLNGSKRPIPNSQDHKLTLHVHGNNCPTDDDLKAAFTAIKADRIWNRFNPSGNVTFSADLEVLDRMPVIRHDLPVAGEDPNSVPRKFNPATDLKFTFNFSGPSLTPSFFPYELTDVAGWLEYKNGRADVAHIAARHGATRLKLAAAEIRFHPSGAVWANVGGLHITPFIADAELIAALPPGLRTGVEDLKLKGNAELLIKHLVVSDPPPPHAADAATGTVVGAANAGPRIATPRQPIVRGQAPESLPPITESGTDPVIYWDAELRLAGGSFDTGVTWEQVFGAVGCRGRYEGTHTGLIRGAVWFDRAVIARQPLTRLSARVAAAPQLPDPARPGEYLPTELEINDIAGDLFHGALGGQARVAFADSTRFHLWLTATDVQLDEVAKHYKIGSDADLKGIAQAQLLLFNRPDPKTGELTTEGFGKIDVPTGRMYNLPVLLDLVKVLKLQAPDKTAFEEAHATFRVHGDRIRVEQADLIGKAVCLGGSGELDISGEYVKFDFYTVGSQVLARMINTPVGDLTAFLSKNLFRIKLTRENGELIYRPEAVPLVTEPARAVADRLRARAASMFGGAMK